MKKSCIFLIILCIFILGCKKQQSAGSYPESNIIKENLTENKEKVIMKVQKPLFLCWVTSKEGLRVRDVPDLNGTKIGLLEYKSEVEVYEIGNKELIDNKLAFWLKVKLEDQYGWIYGGYVSVIPENPCVETEILPLTEKNLAGTWSQRTESSMITDFSIGEVFEESGKYYSGLLHSSWGTVGSYKIDAANQEIIISERVIDDEYMEETLYEYKLMVKKLSCDELIYEYINDNSPTKTLEIKKYNRIPERFLNLNKASTIEWLNYINKYGNEELFTGSTVFMYSVLMKQNDVALFLINSDIDINHKNKNGETAADFIKNNEDNYLSEILKPEKEENSVPDSNTLLEHIPKEEHNTPSGDFDETPDFKTFKIEDTGWMFEKI